MTPATNPESDRELTTTVEITVVVPTYNERDNIDELVSRLDTALADLAWEVIFVDDDSRDGTADRVRRLARRDVRVRCIQRIGRRGLASAVIEGMLASTSPYIAVMDADLQHDETLLPAMHRALSESRFDVVIGSRMVTGGDNQSLHGWRRRGSELSSRIARRLLKLDVRDLMSGFFMLRREVFHDSVHRLSGSGFKILLDILASSPRPLRLVELPYRFRQRQAGVSKLDAHAVLSLAMTLLDKKIGWLLPNRLLAFLTVGSTGVLVHFLILVTALKGAGASFVMSQATAVLVSMTSNFLVNNAFTYRDVRLRGRQLFIGWLSFMLICGIGAVANVGVAGAMFAGAFAWQVSALAGIVVGTVWNYGVTQRYTWQV